MSHSEVPLHPGEETETDEPGREMSLPRAREEAQRCGKQAGASLAGDTGRRRGTPRSHGWCTPRE